MKKLIALMIVLFSMIEAVNAVQNEGLVLMD